MKSLHTTTEPTTVKSTGSKIFFVLMMLFIALSVSATYYKYMVLRDYETYEYIEDDPEIEYESNEDFN